MEIFCKFGDKGDHLLKNPHKLACGSNACLVCIKEELRNNANGTINCICNQKHQITDINTLEIERQPLICIENNIKHLMNEFLDKLEQSLDGLKRTKEK